MNVLTIVEEQTTRMSKKRPKNVFGQPEDVLTRIVIFDLDEYTNRSDPRERVNTFPSHKKRLSPNTPTPTDTIYAAVGEFPTTTIRDIRKGSRRAPFSRSRFSRTTGNVHVEIVGINFAETNRSIDRSQ